MGDRDGVVERKLFGAVARDLQSTYYSGV